MDDGLRMHFGMAFRGESQEQAVGAQHVVAVAAVAARDGLVDERGLHPQAVAPVEGAPGIVREEDARGFELRRVLRAQPVVRRGLEQLVRWCRHAIGAWLGLSGGWPPLCLFGGRFAVGRLLISLCGWGRLISLCGGQFAGTGSLRISLCGGRYAGGCAHFRFGFGWSRFRAGGSPMGFYRSRAHGP